DVAVLPRTAVLSAVEVDVVLDRVGLDPPAREVPGRAGARRAPRALTENGGGRREAGRAEERASIERHGSSCSGKGGWRHEGLELALEQPREGQTREVAVLRADDLHADRQPCGREAAGRRP